MSYMSPSEIRRAIGEDNARFLEDLGSALPPHPRMLDIYRLQAVIGRPFTEEMQTSQPIPPTIRFPFKASDYYQEAPTEGHNSCFVCSFPNKRPYYANGHFTLNARFKKYSVQFYALFETSHDPLSGHRKNDCSYAVESFQEILQSSLARYNKNIISFEDIESSLCRTFTVFRDRIEAVGYLLKNTKAASAILIDRQLWTINVGKALAFIASKQAIENSYFTQKNLGRSSGSSQTDKDLWSSAQITMTLFEHIPRGSFGVVGSTGLFSKISLKSVCNGIEVYQANRHLPPTISDIATNIIFSARQCKNPIEEATVIVFSLEKREDSDEYVLVDPDNL